MFVGHSLLAFALVASVATLLGCQRNRALTAGAVSAALALAPDADVAYALGGVASVDPAGVFDVTSAFWAASTLIHRSATHSLVLAVPAAVAVALWFDGRSWARGLSLSTFASLVAVSLAASGALDAAAVAAFAIVCLVVAECARRWTGLSTRAVLGAGLVALLSHPFGDLFTGQPPRLLYPFEATVLSSRLTLSADPTIHLLAAFGIELAVVWVAAAVYVWLTGRTVGRFVHPVSGLGAAYGGTALFIQAPTLDVSYHFVFSILGVGLVLAAVTLWRRAVQRRPFSGSELADGVDPRSETHLNADLALSALLSGTLAVTVAWAAYLWAYLAL